MDDLDRANSEAIKTKRTINPRDCPMCEYDRGFPGFEGGGWLQQDNNGPIVSCPMCNDDGAYQPAHVASKGA